MIDTDALSAQLRRESVDVSNQRLLVSRLAGSDQEPDLSEPVNCDGLGRIRHFHATTPAPWPANPLPWLPARRHLGADAVPDEGAQAQVFQNAACNWRCWYCFVPFNLLRADPGRSEWVSAEDLVEKYLALPKRPAILDLSGGQPDLVPEWAVWTLRALIDRGVDTTTFLWSDDNLSNDYLFRYLSNDDIELLAHHPAYGRVGCLKGFDRDSFAFNTAAAPVLFERQLELVNRLVERFPNLYLYVTLTAPEIPRDADATLIRLLSTLADINAGLPARTVPLQVTTFTPTLPRMRPEHRAALKVQTEMVYRWNSLLPQFADVPTQGSA
ncbi:MAG: hypothetical protein QOC82_862 [Frankiaceae bacterium]|nr:hypothetical protein [Frankiaceae bacterium]